MMKRLLFWEFPRASWRYDLVVALILAFIFLTPRSWFGDQPRTSSVVQLPGEAGAEIYWLEEDLLRSVPDSNKPARAAELIASRYKHKVQVLRVEQIVGAEGESRGFMAFAREARNSAVK
jgi:hypothetical protein